MSYVLYHLTLYKSDYHICVSFIMDPYFVQVGAIHANPITCIISSDFVQVGLSHLCVMYYGPLLCTSRGLFILTLLYALFHKTLYKSDCLIYMSHIIGPYFVQVGAFSF